MPLPKDVRIDRFLTNLLAGMSNEEFVANNVLPGIFPDAETGWIAKMGKDHYRIDWGARAPGQPAHRIEWGTDRTPFMSEEWRLEHPVDDRTRDAYQRPFDAFRDGTFTLRHMLDTKKEDLVSSLVMNAANYPAGNADTAAKSWSDYTDGASDPVADVQVAKSAIVNASGVGEMNLYGVCSYNVFVTLRSHPVVKSFYLNTVPGAATPTTLTAAQVAVALGLRGLEVGSAVKNTAPQGQEAVMTPIWGTDGFAVYYKGPASGIMIPNFGYLIYPRVAGLGSVEAVVDRYYQQTITSTVLRARMLMDQIVTMGEMGYLYTQPLATS